MSLKLFEEGRRVADAIENSYLKFNRFIYAFERWLPPRQRRIQGLLDMEKKVKNLYPIFSGEGIRAVISSEWNWRALFGGIFNSVGLMFDYLRSEGRRDSDRSHILFQIIHMYKDDRSGSQEVYHEALQCSSQFEETRRCIERFYSLVFEGVHLEFSVEARDVNDFLKEIYDLNPVDSIMFYRKLQFCYETLLQNCTSSESRNFLRILENVPEAIKVINLLPWKFSTEYANVEAVKRAEQELLRYFNLDKDFDPQICGNKIFDCILELRKEQEILESARADLELLRNQT